MTENICNLLDNLTKHNSKQYGYELSQREISQILKLLDDVKRLEEFEAIGTIDEFKALKEKNTPKKRGIWKSGHTCCPTCERGVVTEDRFCCYCGQALKPKEI